MPEISAGDANVGGMVVDMPDEVKVVLCKSIGQPLLALRAAGRVRGDF